MPKGLRAEAESIVFSVLAALANQGVTLPGDANANQRLDMGDADSIISYLVLGIPCASMDNANADGVNGVSLGDLQWIMDQLVK